MLDIGPFLVFTGLYGEVAGLYRQNSKTSVVPGTLGGISRYWSNIY